MNIYKCFFRTKTVLILILKSYSIYLLSLFFLYCRLFNPYSQLYHRGHTPQADVHHNLQDTQYDSPIPSETQYEDIKQVEYMKLTPSLVNMTASYYDFWIEDHNSSLIEFMTASYYDIWIEDHNSSWIEFMTATYYDIWIKDHNSSLIEFLTASYHDLWIEDDNSSLKEFMTTSYYDLWIEDDNS